MFIVFGCRRGFVPRGRELGQGDVAAGLERLQSILLGAGVGAYLAVSGSRLCVPDRVGRRRQRALPSVLRVPRDHLGTPLVPAHDVTRIVQCLGAQFNAARPPDGRRVIVMATLNVEHLVPVTQHSCFHWAAHRWFSANRRSGHGRRSTLTTGPRFPGAQAAKPTKASGSDRTSPLRHQPGGDTWA